MDDRHYPYFGVPPARQPRPAAQEPALRGKRVILSTPEGFVDDMRAVSQIHVDDAGEVVVDVVSEEAFYRWMLVGVVPTTTSYPHRLVWVQ